MQHPATIENVHRGFGAFVKEMPDFAAAYAEELAGHGGQNLVRMFTESTIPTPAGYFLRGPGYIERDPRSVAIEGRANFANDLYRPASAIPRLQHVVSLVVAAGTNPQVYLTARTEAELHKTRMEASSASPFDAFVYADPTDDSKLQFLRGPSVVPNTALDLWINALSAYSDALSNAAGVSASNQA